MRITKFVVFIISLAFATATFGQEVAERPAYKVGEFWRVDFSYNGNYSFSNMPPKAGILDIVWNGRDGDVYRIDGDQRTFYANLSELDASLFLLLPTQVRRQKSREKENCEVLQFPLRVGDKWTKDCLTEGFGNSREVLLKSTQEIPEVSVTKVPYGEVKSFLITREEGGSNRQYQRQYKIFYSPKSSGGTDSVVTFHLEFPARDPGRRGPTVQFKVIAKLTSVE